MINFSHWDWAESFSLNEAAALITGQEPSEAPPEPYKIQPVIRRLVDACALAYRAHFRKEPIPTNALTVIGIDVVPVGLFGDLTRTLFEGDPKVSRQEIARWLRQSGLQSIYQFEKPTTELPTDAAPLPIEPQIDTKPASPQLSTRERNTLLTIIAVLCKDAGYDITKHAKTAGLIQSTAATMGLGIGESTIESHLKKIPDALETRMK